MPPTMRFSSRESSLPPLPMQQERTASSALGGKGKRSKWPPADPDCNSGRETTWKGFRVDVSSDEPELAARRPSALPSSLPPLSLAGGREVSEALVAPMAQKVPTPPEDRPARTPLQVRRALRVGRGNSRPLSDASLAIDAALPLTPSQLDPSASPLASATAVSDHCRVDDLRALAPDGDGSHTSTLEPRSGLVVSSLAHSSPNHPAHACVAELRAVQCCSSSELPKCDAEAPGNVSSGATACFASLRNSRDDELADLAMQFWKGIHSAFHDPMINAVSRPSISELATTCRPQGVAAC